MGDRFIIGPVTVTKRMMTHERRTRPGAHFEMEEALRPMRHSGCTFLSPLRVTCAWPLAPPYHALNPHVHEERT